MIQTQDCKEADRIIHEGVCYWFRDNKLHLGENESLEHPEDREEGTGYYSHVPLQQEMVEWDRRRSFERILHKDVLKWTILRQQEVSNQTIHKINLN